MNRIWEQLALHSRFGPSDHNPYETLEGNQNWHGKTNPFSSYGADLQGDGLCGHAALITFRSAFLDDIKILYMSRRARSREMLSVQFSLAMVLVHEVAHVVELAKDWMFRFNMVLSRRLKKPDPQKPPEPFVGDQITAELGFAYVNEIVGGRPHHYNWGEPESVQFITDCE